MRDSNYRAIASNKASVTITTSLYDRRALDVTSDKPLVNSLNYLTYLVSSSAKVRETLSVDGGIERLIEILHECHNSTFNLNDNIFNSEKKLLTAWKWTLAFQCLVLVGTRGTEKIRQKVVKAGILPIIATVLDNYLSLHERTFIHANSRQQAPQQPQQQQNRSQNYHQHFQQMQQAQAQQAQATAQVVPTPADNAQPTTINPMNLTNEDQEQFRTQTPQQPTQPSEIDHSNHRHLHIHQPQRAVTPQSQPTQRDQHFLTRDEILQHDPQFAFQPAGPSRQQELEPVQRLDIPQQSPLPAQQIPPQPNALLAQQFNPTMQPLQIQPTQSITNINVQANLNLATAGIEATSLSNHTFPNYFNNNHADNLTHDDYENLTTDQLFKLIRFTIRPPNNSSGTPARNAPIGSANSSSAGSNSSVLNANYNDYINQSINLINSHKNTPITNDVRRRYMILHIIKKLKEEKDLEILDDRFFNDNDYEMDNNLQFLTNLYLQDYETNRTLINSKISVRNFTETGVVIPRDDDIVWSLQLLAYISKYSYLKDVLQNTHLVIDMSIRDKQLKVYLEKQMKLSIKKNLAFKLKPRPKITPKSRKSRKSERSEETSYLKRFNPSASSSPQMLDDINSIHDDNFLLEEDKFELCNKPKESCLTENAEIEEDDDEDDEGDDEEEEVDEDEEDEGDDTDEQKDEIIDKVLDGHEAKNEVHSIDFHDEVPDGAIEELTNSNYINKLYDTIVNCESTINDLERDVKLFQINEKMNQYIEMESKKLVETIISKRKEKKAFLVNKWNYDEYEGFDIDEKNEDQDDSLIEYKKVNLFPIVEKFTFLTGTDMYYWSGVIMRNSCRRNELRGSVRQCGNLECGKWERYPREFSKCRRCKRTKYCSRECQMRAWNCHRNWCVPPNSSSATSTTNTSHNHTHPDDTSLASESVNGPDDE